MKQRLTILGAGESGTGAALLGKAKGYEVFVSDKGPIQDSYKEILHSNAIAFEENNHSESLILKSDLIIKSPGISEKVPLIQKIRKQGIKIISEIEFAAEYSKAKFIAITGSNGKTTTTLLTYHLLKKLGLKVGIAGNVGESLAKQVIKDEYDYFVLELSSFQLDDMYNFKAHVAIILNITPDHLDRYNYEFQNYIDSKFRVIQNMTSTDYLIYFKDDEIVRREVEKRNITSTIFPISLKEKTSIGAFLSEDRINIEIPDTRYAHFDISLSNIPLSGKHNMVNTMAALLAATALRQDEEQFEKSLQNFQNASHRLEETGMLNGIKFINDSKATNVDSVWYALDSFDAPLIWIAGGVDKGNDYKAILPLVEKKVKALICMGKDNSLLHKAFDGKVSKIIDTHNIEDAVKKSLEEAIPGDIVLLSPACASFDLFKNYEDRGNQFKAIVNDLIKNNKINI